MPLGSKEMATNVPIIVESYSDNITRLSDALDAKDLSGVVDVLGSGSGLYGIFDYVIKDSSDSLYARWSDADVDPAPIVRLPT